MRIATLLALATLASPALAEPGGVPLPSIPAVTKPFTVFAGDRRGLVVSDHITYFAGIKQGDATTRVATLFAGNKQGDAWSRESTAARGPQYCNPDVNSDGFLDFFDFDDFVIAFENGDLWADFNVDGFVDFFDFDDFVLAFESGC
jgi:hypothetical protein